jgi:hypothetical protein
MGGKEGKYQASEKKELRECGKKERKWEDFWKEKKVSKERKAKELDEEMDWESCCKTKGSKASKERKIRKLKKGMERGKNVGKIRKEQSRK